MHKFVFFSLLWIILFGINHVNAQQNTTIIGILQDSVSRPITGANVILAHNNDTLRTVSNDTGIFQFNNVKTNNFYIQANALGYKNYINFYKDIDYSKRVLIEIILSPYIIHLNDVVVKEKIQPMILKKDTIEYNASAYNTTDNIENLLRQLPGIKVDKEGNVTSEGLPVTMLRVNGVDFFTGDVKEFIRQLPAGIFNKVQIIEDYGDDAAFSGIKKGSPKKLLNLITKPGMNHGKIGNIKLTAGTEKLYGASLSENFWKDRKQISVATDLNTQKNSIGVNNTNNVGVTYNNSLTRNLSINSSYNLSFSRLSSENTSFEETVNPLGIINNKISSTSKNKTYNHRFNSKIIYKPNELEYIRSTIDLLLNTNNNNSGTFSEQYGLIKQDLLNQSILSNNSPGAKASIFFGRRLDKKGRVITANIQYTNGITNSNQRINNSITYYDSTGNFAKDSIINNLILNTNRVQTGYVSLNYSEPITAYSRIDLNYNLSINKQNNRVITNLNLAHYGIIQIDSLSQSFTSALLTQGVGVDFRYIRKKITMLYGINFQRNGLSENYVNQAHITNSETNFFPALNFHYMASQSDDYELNYSGSSTAPTFDQLQSIKDISDLQNVVVGNPNLKPSFSHSLRLAYRHVGLKTGQTLFFNTSGGVIQNQIINTSTLVKDTLGNLKQITSYLNVNGSYNLNADYNWSMPFKLYSQPFRISVTGSANYNYGIVYADSVKSHNINKVYIQTIRASSYLNIFSFDAAIQYQKTTNQYTTGDGLASNIRVWEFTSQGNIKISNNLNFNIEINKRLNQGYSNIDVNNPFVVNTALGIVLIKKQLINIQIRVLDLFNQSNQINQIAIGNTISNSRSNYVSRYLIFSFNMPISKFGKSDK